MGIDLCHRPTERDRERRGVCVRATAASALIVLMNLLRFLRNLHATLPLQGPDSCTQCRVAEWGGEGTKGESCSALVCHCIKMTQSERVEATGNVGHFTWPSKRRSARKLLIENKLHFNLL